MAVYWQWFVQEGWVPVLACLNLLLMVRVLFWMRAMRQIVTRIEWQHSGVKEKIQYAIAQADISKKEVRRLTGKFEAVEVAGNEDDTLIKKEP